MFKRVLFLLLVLGLVSSASAYVYWDGGADPGTGTGTAWSLPANWEGDLLPAAGSNPAIGPYSFTGGTGAPPMPVVSSDMSGTLYSQVSVGRSGGTYGGPGQMTITTNGHIKAENWILGHGSGSSTPGILWMDDGTATSTGGFSLGNEAAGTLVMTGGLIDVATKFSVGRSNIGGGNASGDFYLHGGLVTMGELSMVKGEDYYDGWLVAESWLDITDGTLETMGAYIYTGSSSSLTGQAAADRIQDWIDADYITAYGANLDGTHITGGGSLAGWSVNVDYNTGSGLITLTAVPEPATMLLLGLGGLALIRRKR